VERRDGAWRVTAVYCVIAALLVAGAAEITRVHRERPDDIEIRVRRVAVEPIEVAALRHDSIARLVTGDPAEPAGMVRIRRDQAGRLVFPNTTAPACLIRETTAASRGGTWAFSWAAPFGRSEPSSRERLCRGFG
jgi:hypothetical protein